MESVAISINLHSPTERKGKETGNGGGHPTPLITTSPLPEPAWVSPSGPRLVHSLWHCAPVAHLHTYTPAPPHAHTCTHTHKCLVSFQSLLRKQNGAPSSPSSSAPRGLLGPQIPETQAQVGHTLAFPGFEKRVTGQGTHQRQVVQSVEYVHIRLWYSTG